MRKEMNRKYGLWRRICALMVVFAVLFSDVSPLLTATAETFICGLEEHRHSESCYENVLVCGEEQVSPHYESSFKLHKHTEACRNAEGEITCGYVENEYYHTHNEFCRDAEGNLVCGLEVKEPHEHTEACYETDQILICENEDPGHKHSDSCYKSQKKLTCDREEKDGHKHNDDCYTEKRTLVCGKAEEEGHHHTDGCYTETVVQVCGQEEDPGHHHTEDCWQDWTELTCGLEENEEHQHGEGCYTAHHDLVCGLEEYDGHQHSEACFETIRELTCGLEEKEGHAHSDACYKTERELTCGKKEEEGHHHSDACYTTWQELVCGEEERSAHVHTDACYREEQKLICMKPTSTHRHSDSCFNDQDLATCGKVEVPVFESTAENWVGGHTHTEACYEKKLVCKLPEHVHTDRCRPKAKPEKSDAVENPEQEDENADSTIPNGNEEDNHPEEEDPETDAGELKGEDSKSEGESLEDEKPENKDSQSEVKGSEDQDAESNAKDPRDEDSESDEKEKKEKDLGSTGKDPKDKTPEPGEEKPETEEVEAGQDSESREEADSGAEINPETESEPESESDLPEVITLGAKDAPVQITVTFSSDAGIPEGTELVVTEAAAPELRVADPQAYVLPSAEHLRKSAGSLKKTALRTHAAEETELPSVDVALTQWQEGEETPEIELYHRALEISLVSGGQIIEPATGSTVSVSVTLPDLEEGLVVEVRHEIEQGFVLLDSRTEGQTVTFETDGFSLFDFTSTARKITSWTSDLLENTLFGRSENENAEHNSINIDENSIPDGFSILEAFSTTQSNNLWLMMQRVKDFALGKLESINLYAVEDGKLAGLVKENIGITDVLRFNLGNYSSFAMVRDNGLRNKVEELGNVILSGLMPKNGLAEATDVTEEYADFVPSRSVEQGEADETSIEQGETVGTENGEAAHTIAAYDISITNDGEEYQPEDKPIEVTIKDETIAKAVANGNAISLWHVLDDGTTEQITAFTVNDDTVTFSATGFSVYVLTETTVEKILTASDGKVYKITVTYDGSAQIPEGAELVVTEVAEDQYLASTAIALGVDESYLLYRKFLDISFIDADGAVVEPATPVKVKIELLDVNAGADKLQVVHFGTDGAEEVQSQVADGTVIFESKDFSVYGFGNVLEPLASTETEEASIELLGFGTETQLTATDAPEVEEGLAVLASYNVDNESQLWIKAELKEGVELTDMESVAVYSVKDSNGEDEIGKAVEELVGMDTIAELPTTEFAVIKDSGYRHLSFNLTPDEDKTVTLDGMMPKMATAEAADVTENYTDHEFTESAPIYNEETGAESTPEDEEEGEKQQEETADDVGEEEQEANEEEQEANEEEQEANEEEQQEAADDYTTQRSAIAAYDISISNNDADYQPDEEHPVAVVITDERILPGSNLELWHIKDDGTEEQVEDFSITTGTLSFTATGFSTYALVSTITTYYQTASGETYKITVEYGEDAELPEGAELRITEVAADEYLADTATALGTTDSYLLYKKFFDISFVRTDEDEEHIIEPNAPVNVTIELLDVTDGADKLQVVHFGADGAEKVTATATEEAVVSFTSSEFCVFGIGNVLTPIATAETEEANIEILGFSGEAQINTAEAPAVEEGLEVIGAYNLSNEAENVWIKADVKDGVELSSMESVMIYTIKDSATETPTEEQEDGESTGDEQTNEMPDEKPTEDQGAEQSEEQNSVKSATVENGLVSELVEAGTVAELTVSNFVLVKDTGYRHLSFEISVGGEEDQVEETDDATEQPQDEEFGDATVNVIILDGMMPKMATAEAVDVTEAYADHEYVVPEEETIDETSTEEEPTEEQPVSNDAGEDAEEAVDTQEGVEEPQEGVETQQEDSEVEQEEAVEQKRTTLAAFNITISNNEFEYQPDADHPIRVEIVDSRITAGENIELWHIKDDGTEERVEEFTVEEGRIGFVAYGFSAYVIVQGPDPQQTGMIYAQSVAELDGNSFHISNYRQKTSYYYLNNTLSGGNITTVTDIDSSTLYYFTKIDGTENKFRIYYLNANDQPVFLCTKDEKGGQFYFQLDGNSTYDYEFKIRETSQGGEFYISSATDKTNDDKQNYWYFDNSAVKKNRGFADGDYDAGGGKTVSRSENDGNEKPIRFLFAKRNSIQEETYGLDGKNFGLMNWNSSVTGRAMMAESSAEGVLDAKILAVLSKKENNAEKLFVPNDSDITMWKFAWVRDDIYYLSVTVDGATKYLTIGGSGLSLSDDPSEIRVIPGTGTNYAGKIALKSGNKTLTYSGSVSNGFSTTGSAGSEWLYLVDFSELSADYLTTYSAQKVSVSLSNDPEEIQVTNGSKIVVYTRVWNDSAKKYEFYAIDHEGKLVRCYESGDSIQWIADRINTLLWDFTEYYWEGTTDPNYYYELQNEYSGKYIAPQADGQVLSDNKIGILLNGRKEGIYYTTIGAWDKTYQTYAGLKAYVDNANTDNNRIISTSLMEADDFYFAIMEGIAVDDETTTVPTVEHTQYGITMKMVDFDTRVRMSDFLGNNTTNLQNPTPNLLSTNLGNDNYPTAKGGSLGSLFAGAQEVNHLFIQSTYSGSGYYEYDSTQNYATLKGNTSGNFTVYKELGTHDENDSVTRKHGQFFPYNDLAPGVYSTKNPQNLYDAQGRLLSDDNPRKYEPLYQIQPRQGETYANFYFGMEIEARFVQTPSGRDAWGHDIIYEFTGDDDFWLYVDGELIIDLGGIHSALPGSVNYATGKVVVNGTQKTLLEIFEQNYRGRNPTATDEEVNTYLADYFAKKADGTFETVFMDYSTHTMRIFYMERGAGGSNLHMRFNLASVKKGYVELSKEIDGVDGIDESQVVFPYQIYYKLPSDDSEEEHLTDQDDNDITVTYKGSGIPVEYQPRYTIDGKEYENVFLLKPGRQAEIDLPDNLISYRIVECCVNEVIYDVDVNKEDPSEIVVRQDTGIEDRADYSTTPANSETRSRVAFTNTAKQEAFRTLYIRKVLYNESATAEVHDPYNANTPTFGFRVYLKPENNTSSIDDLPASMFPYYVRDPEGYYCRWDVDQQIFVRIEDSSGAGINNYSETTKDLINSAMIQSSPNGTISNIPAFFTVEMRNILIGTQYKVNERDNEVPKGYSKWKLVGYDDNPWKNDGLLVYTGNSTSMEAGTATPVQGTIEEDKDPLVDVYNLKGYGISLTKEWTDADYVETRDPAYFAVYIVKENETPELVNNTVYQLPYGKTELYWYLSGLEDGTTFNNYEVREVSVTDPTVTPVYSEDGKFVYNLVTGYDSITPVNADGTQTGTILINGKLKGDTGNQDFQYTVSYTKGNFITRTNVREDRITNSREGIVFRKTDMQGSALANAEFTLKDADNNNLIGTYTSGEDGIITTALFVTNKRYTLEEIKSPYSSNTLYTGYFGLQSPITIWVDSSENIHITTNETDYVAVDQDTDTITIKNRVYHFQAIKVDKDNTNIPVSGAVFSLHKKKTVGTWTGYDFNPEKGYESLSSDVDGNIEKIDTTLPQGSYELREKQAPGNYKSLGSYIHFTISNLNVVTLDDTNRQDGVQIVTEHPDNNSVIYKMIIPNESDASMAELTIQKQVSGAMGDLTKQFSFILDSVADGEETTQYDWTKTNADGTADTGSIKQGETFTLAHDELIRIYVPYNKAVTITEENENYTTSWQRGAQTPVSSNQITATITEAQKRTTIVVTNDLHAVAPTAYTSRHTPFLLLLIFGTFLIILAGGWKYRTRLFTVHNRLVSHNEVPIADINRKHAAGSDYDGCTTGQYTSQHEGTENSSGIGLTSSMVNQTWVKDTMASQMNGEPPCPQMSSTFGRETQSRVRPSVPPCPQTSLWTQPGKRGGAG